MRPNKTFIPKVSDLKRSWYVIDAEGLVLGRLAAIVANKLRGKDKVYFTPNMQCGDNIIILNSEKVLLKGQKRYNKKYYRHTGYPGGIKSTTPEKILTGKTPSKVIELAVKRMVPKGPLGKKVLKQLHVFSGFNHPFESQKPEIIDIKSLTNSLFISSFFVISKEPWLDTTLPGKNFSEFGFGVISVCININYI